MHPYVRKSMKSPAARALGALVALAAIGVSIAAVAEDKPGRYTMTPAEGGGFIRLDRETGAMSICSGKEGEWACKPMPETDAATKKKLEQLENENRALRSEKGQATPSPQATAPSGDTIPPDAPRDGAKGDTIPPAPPGDLPMPTERDVDKLFDYVEGMVKKFKERIDRLEKEAKKEPATPL